ncbi:MAG TPA: PLP-dependent transferase, partial [Caulobacter sp.]|nr:PLP-dependent transferase [Caulobacter sp.]
DLSVQALTKYVCGHSDIFMGSAAANDAGLAAKLETGVHDFGWSVTGDAAYDVLRSLRTLPTRLARHDETARAVAGWLSGQPHVLRVLHPALPGAPGHALWDRDYSGASGLFGFVLNPCPIEVEHAFLDALRIFGLGFSWGGFESLAIRCDPQLKSRTFVKALEGPLFRLHIGLEAASDLIADLAAGFAAFDGALAR